MREREGPALLPLVAVVSRRVFRVSRDLPIRARPIRAGRRQAARGGERFGGRRRALRGGGRVRPSVLIVVPARYGATRFPGKPLALVAGIPLVERVRRLCLRTPGRPRVIVATDDARVLRAVKAFGGEARMTRRDHPSGTDRAAEVARAVPCDLVVNVQGDEPLLAPREIGRLVAAMARDRAVEMATLCHPIRDPCEMANPNAVKVVLDARGNALYFSRAPVPYFRDGPPSASVRRRCFRHIGIYAYRRSFLLRYVRWPQSFLEKAEKLEQLRALERGVRIRVLKSGYEPVGVDVPADVKRVERRLRK
ncbi:MAG: 3-deoxy-manno-octulosonate cytidylyltransferase [Verrucomicrobiae bacterium]|nr:3-deoxy-manno-octulosonate cytidylyltransferase [Verrucomicrobiae bacterium]